MTTVSQGGAPDFGAWWKQNNPQGYADWNANSVVPQGMDPNGPEAFARSKQGANMFQAAYDPWMALQRPASPSPAAAPQYGSGAPMPPTPGPQAPGGNGNPFNSYLQNLGMGAPPSPSAAPGTAPQAPQGGGMAAPGGNGMSNPYLTDQANAITGQVATNFNQQIAPSIRRNSMLTGGFGGSRQGVAEGLAAQGAQTSLANSLANLYGTAYESDANRKNTFGIASMQDSTNRYGVDVGAATTRRGQDTTAKTAADANATNRYGIDQNTGLGYAGLANTKDIATMGNETQRYGIDTGANTTRYVTDTNNQTQRYGIDTGAQTARDANATNRYGIDTGAATSRYNTDTNSATQRYGVDSAATTAGNANATNRYGIDTGAATAAANNSTNRYGMDLQSQLGNRNADLSQTRLGSEMFNSAVQGASQMYDTIYKSGDQEMMAEFNKVIKPLMDMLTGASAGTGGAVVKKTGS